jgi:hypothetical protein
VSLHRASLSTAAQIAEGAALRVVVQQARANGRKPQAEVREHLRRNVWPEVLAENIGADYPDAKRSVGLHGLDLWVRAGFCHGVVDTLAGRGPRPKHSAAADDQWQAYTVGYMTGSFVMTGVDA